MGITGCCYGTNKQVIYVIGSRENKELFFKNVLSADTPEENFFEIERSFGSQSVIIQSCGQGTSLSEINALHTKVSSGIVYLSDADEAINTRKKALFVLMTGKSKQESDEKMIISSVVNGSYADCKTGFNKLVNMIRS